MNYLVTVNNLYSYNLQSFYIQLSHISRLSIQNKEIYMGLIIQELYYYVSSWQYMLSPILVWFYPVSQ